MRWPQDGVMIGRQSVSVKDGNPRCAEGYRPSSVPSEFFYFLFFGFSDGGGRGGPTASCRGVHDSSPTIRILFQLG